LREAGFAPIRFPWPLPRPRDWTAHVNQVQTEAELAALRKCIERGSPYGDSAWIGSTAKTLSLEFTLRPRGRPSRLAENG
jgi:putative transposase